MLQRLGRARLGEGALEALAPLGLAGLGWGLAVLYLSAPAPALGITRVELAALLGACAALAGWAAGRLLYLLRRRRPWAGVLGTWALLSLLLLLLPGLCAQRFATACHEAWSGTLEVDQVPVLWGQAPRPLCRVARAESTYLGGLLLRPRWDGALGLGWWPPLLAVGALAALARRDRRLQPSWLVERVLRQLPYALARGSGTAPALGQRGAGQPAAATPTPGAPPLLACEHLTWWGELCGQLYHPQDAPQTHQACVRCHQGFRPDTRALVVQVVSLRTADVDQLNAWERLDPESWAPGAVRDGTSKTTEPRWVLLGELTLPSVLTVAQALALVHEQLAVWKRSPPKTATPHHGAALELAERRASRLAAWLWTGADPSLLPSRLVYARPCAQAQLIVGPQRLRDVAPSGGGKLVLQLETGALPLERWEALLRPNRGGLTNVRSALWIPVAPPPRPSEEPGLWVPRVEGDALRAWLREVRRPADAPEGAQTAFCWTPPDPAPGAAANPRPAQSPPREPLHYVMRPLAQAPATVGQTADRGTQTSPSTQQPEPSQQPQPGESIAEWAWLERAQIQQLRQEVLVLVNRSNG